MSSTAVERRALTINDFCRAYGIGRTLAKELIRDGKVVRRYVGRRSLVDFASAEQWYASLPTSSANVQRTAANLPNGRRQ